jgi:hypothetical protein
MVIDMFGKPQGGLTVCPVNLVVLFIVLGLFFWRNSSDNGDVLSLLSYKRGCI